MVRNRMSSTSSRFDPWSNRTSVEKSTRELPRRMSCMMLSRSFWGILAKRQIAVASNSIVRPSELVEIYPKPLNSNTEQFQIAKQHTYFQGLRRSSRLLDERDVLFQPNDVLVRRLDMDLLREPMCFWAQHRRDMRYKTRPSGRKC
jgi:hypothetical protein